MADILLWLDDFTYATQGDFEAAYTDKFNPGSGTGVIGVTLVTPGVDTYANGVTSRNGVPDDYAALFDVTPDQLGTPGRCFHFQAAFQIDTQDIINSGQSLVNMGAMPADGSDFYGTFWQLSVRLSDLSELALTVKGGPYPTPSYFSGYVPGILTPNAKNLIDVFGHISSLFEASPGVYAANADGDVTVQVNGVTAFTFSGLVWNNWDTLPAQVWNTFEIHPSGTMSALRVWTCNTASSTSPVDNSVPCCVETQTPGGTTAGETLPPDDRFPLPPLVSVCDVGGVGPDGNTPTFSEDWSVV